MSSIARLRSPALVPPTSVMAGQEELVLGEELVLEEEELLLGEEELVLGEEELVLGEEQHTSPSWPTLVPTRDQTPTP